MSFVFVLVFLTVFKTQAYAKILTNQNGSVNVAKTEIINDDLFIGARSATIDGTVNGDLFVGGQTVMINGTINGNVHVGAATVVLSGKIKGNAYIGSGNITISKSSIGGSLLAGTGNLNIDKDSVISGSLIAGAGNVSVDSWIRRSVYLGAGSAVFGTNTRIGKDLYYATDKNGQQIDIKKGAVISGNTYKNIYQAPQAPKMPDKRAMQMAKSIISIVSLLGTFVVGILYLRFCRTQFTGSAELVIKNFWKSFGIGFLITIAIIPAMIIALITIIGVPLAGITFLMLLLGLYFAKLVTALAVGNWIASKFKWEKLSHYWTFAVGLVIVYLLKMIPIAGIFVSVIVLWTGLGALTMQMFHKSKA